MTFQEFLTFIRADLFRYEGKISFLLFLRYVLIDPGYKTTFLMRLSKYLHGKRLMLPLFILVRIVARHYRFRYGIDIPFQTRIGAGLYIGHFGGIIVNEEAVIGRNCNLSQNVTIGQANRGKRAGVPTIGDYVFIGPAAQIIGKVEIGNHASIGAGAIVMIDVPEQGVAVGVPAKVISLNGSEGYINHCWESGIYS